MDLQPEVVDIFTAHSVQVFFQVSLLVIAGAIAILLAQLTSDVEVKWKEARQRTNVYTLVSRSTAQLARRDDPPLGS